MVELDQEETAPTNTVNNNMASKKKELLSTAMKRTSEWFDSCIFFGFIFLLYRLSHKEFQDLVSIFYIGYLHNEDGTMNYCRIFSQEIPSDVTVHAEGASFSLHKVGLGFNL